MTADERPNIPLFYLGPPGAGFGFQLAGMAVTSCATAAALLEQLRLRAAETPQSIIFVDERLAADVLDEVEQLNDSVLPAIVLVPGAAVGRQLSAEKLQRLMVRAVGSDIFSS